MSVAMYDTILSDLGHTLTFGNCVLVPVVLERYQISIYKMLFFFSSVSAGSEPQVYISADPIDQLYGEKVTVTADVMGLSVASYQWLKDDMDLSTAKYPACDGLGTNKLIISSFTHDYEGRYQCAVSFSGGEVVKSVHIKLALGKLRPII